MDCPTDSYRLPNRRAPGDCCSHPQGCECLPGPCPEPDCTVGEHARVVRQGNQKPGTCCPLYKCVELGKEFPRVQECQHYLYLTCYQWTECITCICAALKGSAGLFIVICLNPHTLQGTSCILFLAQRCIFLVFSFMEQPDSCCLASNNAKCNSNTWYILLVSIVLLVWFYLLFDEISERYVSCQKLGLIFCGLWNIVFWILWKYINRRWYLLLKTSMERAKKVISFCIHSTLYLFVFYVTIHSVRRVVLNVSVISEWWIGMVKMWKKLSIAYIRYYHSICLEIWGESWKTSFRIPSVRAKIWTWFLPNMKH